jgi:hypothetical protein
VIASVYQLLHDSPGTRNLKEKTMARNREIPELLEQYMEHSGGTEQWITVMEFRTHFQLDEFSASAISGFLRRIYQRPFFSCPYRVERIEKIIVHKPQRRIIKRYLVKKRPESPGKPARNRAP